MTQTVGLGPFECVRLVMTQLLIDRMTVIVVIQWLMNQEGREEDGKYRPTNKGAKI